MKRNISLLGKTVPTLVVALMLFSGIGFAALLTNYGIITGTAEVDQSVLVDGEGYEDSLTLTYTIDTAVGGNTYMDEPHTLKDRADVPAYIAVGTTEVSNIHYPWVLKVDSDGNEMWDWSITEYTVDEEVLDIDYCWQSKIMQISDGGYIISLTAIDVYYNDEEYPFGCIAKLSSDGDEEWINILGDGFEWTIHCEYLLEVEDGILGVGAYTPLPDPGFGIDKSGCLFKINNFGELAWHKEYDYGEFVDKLNGISVTNDGGFLLAGGVGIVDGVYWDGWLVKTDSQGEKEWEKIFSGPKNDFFWGIIQMDNDDYMIVGWTESFGFGNMDVWVMRTDSNGNEIWNKTFGDSRYEIGYDYDFTDDGGVFIPMLINDMFTKESYVIKMDSDGNAEYKHVYFVESKPYFIGICSTSDGGCIAAGILGGWDSSNSDALLVKYASFENQRPNKPVKPTGPSNGDPDIEYTFSTSSSDPDGDSLQYRWDWGDGEYSNWLDTNEATYTWEIEDNFEIRVMVQDENGGESEWSDPLVFSTPKIKIINQYLIIIQRLLERFQILEFLI